MAHIANKIDAKDKQLAEILFNQRYRVDSFQREYRWQRKHIEALISDLSISFLNNYESEHKIDDSLSYDCYYMGPVVLCQDSNELSIVDGQQRLTSFTLLIIFLYHLQKELSSQSVLRDLMSHLYTSKGGKKTLILNVESRNGVIEHLLDNPNRVFDEISISEVVDESIVNILGRYEDISLLFPEELREENVLPLFIEWLLERVILIEVKAYSMENAYTIFETMNDRGMTLSPTEILKGFLLSKITDEVKADEANEFWKSRIYKINRDTKVDADLDFFRAWLRAKYALTSRIKKAGAENEDFEIIATQFHSWVKKNTKKVYLKESVDYYYFIVSDLDFYSDLYIRIYSFKNSNQENFNDIYINNFYPIADSLYYPLIIASILKSDDENSVRDKIILMNKFIDIYTNVRVISGKSITQSSIRYYIYDLIKDIRNLSYEDLKIVIIEKFSELHSKEVGFDDFQQMNNWGYYHYFFSRVLFFLKNDDIDFQDLVRSKKRNSFILQQLFEEKDFEGASDSSNYLLYFNSLANFCLIRRYHIEEFNSKKTFISRLKFLIKNEYIPEMNNLGEGINIVDFIKERDSVLKSCYNSIWSF